jgi:transposase
VPRKPRGATPKLSPEQQARLRARLDAGPLPGDGVCTLRGKDVVRILEREFGVRHTIGSVYSVLHRIGYSCLAPRPRHEKSDPQAVESFKRDAPLLSGPRARRSHRTAGGRGSSSSTRRGSGGRAR